MTKQAGYPDKTPAAKPPIAVDSYTSQGVKTRPPAAAKFGVGATSLPKINDALDQRRAHNEALSDPGRQGYEFLAAFPRGQHSTCEIGQP